MYIFRDNFAFLKSIIPGNWCTQCELQKLYSHVMEQFKGSNIGFHYFNIKTCKRHGIQGLHYFDDSAQK